MDTVLRLKKYKTKKIVKETIKFAMLISFAFFMIYPLLWIVGASFNEGAKASIWFLPKSSRLRVGKMHLGLLVGGAIVVILSFELYGTLCNMSFLKSFL